MVGYALNVSGGSFGVSSTKTEQRKQDTNHPVEIAIMSTREDMKIPQKECT